MAGERALPGLGLYGFWTLGSNGYKTQMDGNFQKLSALVQPSVKSSLAAVPGSPVDGDIHRLTVAPNLNALAVRDNGAWVYLTPAKGWKIYDQAANQTLLFNGANWVNSAAAIINGSVVPTTEGFDGDFYFRTGTNVLYGPKAGGVWPAGLVFGGAAGAFSITEKTAAYTLVAGDFAGNKEIAMNTAVSVTLTLNTGLVVVEPLLVVQRGAGQVTLAGSATFRSAGGALKSRVQYSSFSIIPQETADVYLIVGDITV